MTSMIDLANAQQNGARLVSESRLATLDHDARARGRSVRHIGLAGCCDKYDLLRRIASALAFPTTFGMNWDALADCLGDLAWLPQADGHVWLLDHAGDLRSASAADFDILYGILDDACARWRERGTPCFAFLALPDDASIRHADRRG